MSPLSESLNAQALRELKETTCAGCGEPKKSGESFCRACYFSLTPKQRSSLYTLMSNGYAQIYDEIKSELKAR
jgi:predicted amidophosphoribosyltransferase